MKTQINNTINSYVSVQETSSGAMALAMLPFLLVCGLVVAAVAVPVLLFFTVDLDFWAPVAVAGVLGVVVCGLLYALRRVLIPLGIGSLALTGIAYTGIALGDSILYALQVAVGAVVSALPWLGLAGLSVATVLGVGLVAIRLIEIYQLRQDRRQLQMESMRQQLGAHSVQALPSPNEAVAFWVVEPSKVEAEQ